MGEAVFCSPVKNNQAHIVSKDGYALHVAILKDANGSWKMEDVYRILYRQGFHYQGRSFAFVVRPCAAAIVAHSWLPSWEDHQKALPFDEKLVGTIFMESGFQALQGKNDKIGGFLWRKSYERKDFSVETLLTDLVISLMGLSPFMPFINDVDKFQ
ncbi:MAG: hypothetical protein ACOYK8_10775 [Alphaproteobacteria bacterium]